MKDHKLGVLSGIGMVIANMIGTGVFISTGYMAQSLTPKQILLAWVVGAFLALAGARAYASIAQIVPKSGGEYKYLSTLIHPALGYLAGWASLLLGFSAPIAIDAFAAGAFANTLLTWIDPKIFGALVIILLTGVHAIGIRFSVTTQNILVLLKIALVVGFIVIGLIGGHNSWPEWQPPSQLEGFPVGSFMQNLLFITFAFLGWNAAVYAASEFRNPKRDVSRAILLGCGLVGVLYLVVNWVFVANLTPEQFAIVTSDETGRITLGHLIMTNLIGETGAACMSVLVIIAFISAMSAMMFLGPRVYAEMAKDSFLPRVLRGKDGKAPVGAVILQGAIALFLVFAYQLGELLSNVGAILTLFSALTVFGLLWIYFKKRGAYRSGPVVLIAGIFYLVMSGVMLYFGFKMSGILSLWVGACILASLIGYFLTRRRFLSRKERIAATEEISQ
ncbi:MAG: amino acid permease [Acidobacteriota bacterium]|jgi:APA family basic amino acid/polyamine antiporter